MGATVPPYSSLCLEVCGKLDEWASCNQHLMESKSVGPGQPPVQHLNENILTCLSPSPESLHGVLRVPPFCTAVRCEVRLILSMKLPLPSRATFGGLRTHFCGLDYIHKHMFLMAVH